jgi:mannobiose 2-epimerase
MKLDIQKNIPQCECLEPLDHIFRFWSGLKDDIFGGFYGQVGFDGIVDRTADKGVILNSRILWFFSSLYCVNRDEAALMNARHAYKFLVNNMLDAKYDGLYWMCDCNGRPVDSRKHSYCQAFGIYGLSQYYKASGDEQAVELAMKLFNLIETKCKDDTGYLEEFNRKWEREPNELLSENKVISERTMNTHLHILEAYTVLYEVTKNEAVKKQLYFLLGVIKERIYSREFKRLKVFFDDEWNETIDIQSYGHDIEGSWLVDRAVEVLNDKNLLEATQSYTLDIAENILNNAYTPFGVINETVNHVTDYNKIWWVQAESVVGFINAYEKSGNKRFFEAAVNIWNYIHEKVIDKKSGEWYWMFDESGSPVSDFPFVSAWKCPYHNSRMYFELMARGKDYV